MNTILAIIFTLQLGYIPEGITNQFDITGIEEQCFYTDLSVEFKILNIFFIGGYSRIYLTFTEMDFYPFEIYFGFSARIKFTENIEIGFKHTYIHPIIFSRQYYNNMGDNMDSYNEFYFKVKGEIKLF
jgi:hypothetical protein